MVKEYLIVTTEAKAQESIAFLDANMGYPDEETNTTTSTQYLPTRDGRFGVLICPMCRPLVPDNQVENLVSVPFFNANLAVEMELN